VSILEEKNKKKPCIQNCIQGKGTTKCTPTQKKLKQKPMNETQDRHYHQLADLTSLMPDKKNWRQQDDQPEDTATPWLNGSVGGN
jgi:predicted metal-dependent HD superfamily phosphohydrolase